MYYCQLGQPSLPPETLSKHISILHVALCCCTCDLNILPFNLTCYFFLWCFSVFWTKALPPNDNYLCERFLNVCDRCWQSPKKPVELGTCCLSDDLRGAVYLLLCSLEPDFSPINSTLHHPWNLGRDRRHQTLI